MIGLLKPYYDLKKKYRHYQEISALYEEQRTQNVGKQVQYWNWWKDNSTAYWLQRFIENGSLLKNTNEKIALCSIFGEREVLDRVRGKKIFFSGENLHMPDKKPYADALLGDKQCRLSLGFDYYEDNRYLRFPLWLTYVFEPTLDELKIRERCEQLRYPFVGNRESFACLIARADNSGLRTEMYNMMSELGKVDCPSGLYHNDNSLKELFGDNKISYMQRYQFNICPENSNAYGYCTEKVFEAIAAGCIPVYWGCYNQPEPKILNQEAIIFWNQKNGGKEAIAQLRELSTEPMKLEAFMHQPRLVEGAEKEVIRMMNELLDKLKILIIDK